MIEVHGRIKWFDTVRGYGFIVPDELGQPDVLLTADILQASGYWPRVPPCDMRIIVMATESQRGWKAARVLRLEYPDNWHPQNSGGG